MPFDIRARLRAATQDDVEIAVERSGLAAPQSEAQLLEFFNCMLDGLGLDQDAHVSRDLASLAGPLRRLCAEDIAMVLDSCYVALPITTAEEACEFFQHVLDVFVTPRCGGE